MTPKPRRAARVLLFDDQGRVLLIHFVIPRSDGPFAFWGTPGGGVEPGEQLKLTWKAIAGTTAYYFDFEAHNSSGGNIAWGWYSTPAGLGGANTTTFPSLAGVSGWDASFFGDLHIQGKEGVQFFTQQKVTTSRWFSYGEGDIWHRESK